MLRDRCHERMRLTRNSDDVDVIEQLVTVREMLQKRNKNTKLKHLSVSADTER